MEIFTLIGLLVTAVAVPLAAVWLGIRFMDAVDPRKPDYWDEHW